MSIYHLIRSYVANASLMLLVFVCSYRYCAHNFLKIDIYMYDYIIVNLVGKVFE